MILEIFNGGSVYLEFDTYSEVLEWRKNNKPFSGTLWTEEGHLIKEGVLAEMEGKEDDDS